MHRYFGASPIPRYVQLADLMRQRIARGVWAGGGRLPSLEELMREFDVARVTVRQAVDLLSREGLVSAQRGRGTFVTGQPASRERAIPLETSLRSLAEVYRHDKPKLTLIEEASASPRLEAKDGAPAPRYRFMRRVHSRDGQPYCVISIYLDERVFRRAPARFRRETVIPVLLDLKTRVARAHQTLRIGAADVETAGHLGVPVNSPVADVRRVFRAPDGTVLYLGEVTYRGDYVVLEMDLKP
jgi:GntR family transcriptional regulator